MSARPLHSRDDLLHVIAGRGRVTACNRAMETGNVLVLGGFAPSQGIAVPSWQVSVESKHGKTWVLAIYEKDNQYSVRELPGVRWEYWLGNDQGIPGVYNGDHPMYFAGIKREALERLEDDT